MAEGIPKAVRKDLLAVLKKAQRHINSRDSKKLKHISDYAIHNTSIFQDSDSLSLAVLMYAVSKLLERWGFGGEYAEQIRNLLGSAQLQLEQDNVEGYREEIKKLVELVSTVEKQFKLYVEKVIEKAQIKKGSKLYEHGISMAQAASLLSVSQWDLMNYVGKTKISDTFREAVPIGERLKFTRGLFE